VGSVDMHDCHLPAKFTMLASLGMRKRGLEGGS
jgi:hypothetical protein